MHVEVLLAVRQHKAAYKHQQQRCCRKTRTQYAPAERALLPLDILVWNALPYPVSVKYVGVDPIAHAQNAVLNTNHARELQDADLTIGRTI